MISDLPLTRFFSKVDKGGDGGCWNWTAALNNKGYGVFAWNRERLAHRAAYVLLVGDIPAGMVLRHGCDNPRCVNPAHLEAGTQLENMKDAVHRGRTCRGDEHATKLNETKVREILVSTDPAPVLSKRYGVSVDYISMIQRGVRWAHVKVDNLPLRIQQRREFGRRGEGHHTTTLTATDVLAILTDNRTNQALADAYGTSTTTVSNIKNGKTWQHVTGL